MKLSNKLFKKNLPGFRNTRFQVQEPECPRGRWKETLIEAQLCDVSVTGDQGNKILKYCGEGKDLRTQDWESEQTPGSRRWWGMPWKCSERAIYRHELHTGPVKCEAHRRTFSGTSGLRHASPRHTSSGVEALPQAKRRKTGIRGDPGSRKQGSKPTKDHGDPQDEANGDDKAAKRRDHQIVYRKERPLQKCELRADPMSLTILRGH